MNVTSNTGSSSNPQEMTAPVHTAEFTTPTMTFGEIGETTHSVSTGRKPKTHGLGAFIDTKVLERERLIGETTWSTSDVAGTLIYNTDVNKQLFAVAANQAILSQFNYFRAGIELTMRLNTNQFYYGALMATMIPMGTGFRLDERAVQDPKLVSACSAESIVKTWEYSYPFEWMTCYDVNAGNFPVTFYADVIAPLKVSNENMPTTINLQLWARYKNVELSYPTQAIPTSSPRTLLISGLNLERAHKTGTRKRDDDVRQKQNLRRGTRIESSVTGNNVNLTVTVPASGGASSPTKDKNGDEAKKNSIDKAVDAMSSITIGDAASAVADAGLWAATKLGEAVNFAGAFGFDKPDRTVPIDPVVIDANIDMFVTDIPDVNTTLAMRRSRYLDPSRGRMPKSENWTLSKYAQIPGIRAAPGAPCFTFTAPSQSTQVQLIQTHASQVGSKTPLDFAYVSSGLWRGSIKVALFFFTSSFISARFVVQYVNGNWGGTSSIPSEYDTGLSRVVNVKGDTIDTFTIPWMDLETWSASNLNPLIQVTCETDIAATDTLQTPTIYMVMFVSGGPDIQFACPRVPNFDTEWTSAGQTVESSDFDKDKEKQSAVQEIFAGQGFPPIVENAYYDLDAGYCTTEQLGSMADIAKRYSPMVQTMSSHGPNQGVKDVTFSLQYDFQPVTSTSQYYDYWQFRNTLYGNMRSCFLYSSGGFRYRRKTSSQELWGLTYSASGKTINCEYITPYDGMIRVTVPYAGKNPYKALKYFTGGYNLVPIVAVTEDSSHPEWLAARDDVQFGWPILPTGLASPSSFEKRRSSRVIAQMHLSSDEEFETIDK